MELYIDNKSGAPIYDQIYTQIKNQIVGGELQADEPMPSIRGWRGICASVSSPQSVRMMSWKRGVLYAVPSKGFVAPKTRSCCGRSTINRSNRIWAKRCAWHRPAG